MHSVRYFNISCDPLNISLRAPVDVRCDEPCGSGMYFSAIETQCGPCRPGHSSNSGGRIIRDFSGGIPEGFVTYCDPAPCAAWAPGPLGGMLTSGNQLGSATRRPGADWIDESVTATLVTVVDVINPRGGKFIFSYRVESELYYDSLKVLVNGSQYFEPNAPDTHDFCSRFLLSGMHLSWRRLSIPLPALGSTEVRLVFVKDRDQGSLGDDSQAGDDRAYVCDIGIEGVQMWASSCTPCAPGTVAAQPHAMYCQLCPANTYSAEGWSACQACPARHWSPASSSVHIAKQPCRKTDYVAVYGPCSASSTRQRQWHLAVNSRCAEDDPSSDPAPSPETVACADCMPGFTLSAQTRLCDRCPSVTVRNSGTCKACVAGYAAVLVIDFANGFDQFGSEIDPAWFSMECEGLCTDWPATTPNCTSLNNGFSLVSLPSCNATDPDATIVAVQSDASAEGSRACSACPSGTVSAALRDRCLTQCRITIDHHEYDFSQLQNYRYSLAAPTYEQSTFYFSLCQYANQPVDAEHPNAVQPGARASSARRTAGVTWRSGARAIRSASPTFAGLCKAHTGASP
jgi:hypothetical protein